jgi:acetolactate synthase-1/2/3 large subunit
VLAVWGDGGFMMNSQELETAVRVGVDLVVLVVQDNVYGMIRWKQAADGFADFGTSSPPVPHCSGFGLAS